MCRPTHFAVEYSINPWMDPGRPADAAVATRQWEHLRDLVTALGHRVELVEAVPGLPDMVFTANAATVIDGRALVATFRHPQRAPESDAFDAWFRRHGYPEVHRAASVNEGEGDHLLAGGHILAADGFRTEQASHRETARYFGRPTVELTLVDPRFYHLDTALAVLDEQQIMYYPQAFSPGSRERLRSLFPQAIEADEADAAVFGLNAVSDGRHVVLPAAATALAARLAAHGYRPIGVDLSELLKGGGGPKCCMLELRDAALAPAAGPAGRTAERPAGVRAHHRPPGGRRPGTALG
ncbi:amidinotransferase [Streptacidiphilus sp. PB12-B1b]|uniref:dimethylargininase n=1 Tax=Streptacidiphilus sp. PB12-B1b TaxID=2705012 RepID=UPI0015FD867F|nr:dimethylargininase [Streptacidiphilus sp. PB12-B1b]QMU80261.1 amidinotransferase [Streptacidiphilus sp. PB12-B1b]